MIVGGGHNGLVAAAYLARAGLRTVVFERRAIVGGACTTEEFAPGFRASPGAYVLSLLRPAIWQDFSLRRRGLEVLEAAPTLNVFRDGARLTLHDDPAATAAELARFDPADGARSPPSAPRCTAPASCSDRGSTDRRRGHPDGSERGALRALAPASGPRAATASRPRGCSRPRPASTSSSGSLRAGLARRSAGTRSPTRSRGRRRPGPPTRCCTSTRRAPSAARPGGSSAAAWARSPAARRCRSRGGRRGPDRAPRSSAIEAEARARGRGPASRTATRSARPPCSRTPTRSAPCSGSSTRASCRRRCSLRSAPTAATAPA